MFRSVADQMSSYWFKNRVPTGNFVLTLGYLWPFRTSDMFCDWIWVMPQFTGGLGRTLGCNRLFAAGSGPLHSEVLSPERQVMFVLNPRPCWSPEYKGP